MAEAKKDVVIGCITNYNFEQIEPWVSSLHESGFDGHKIMICYNINYETVNELTKRNFEVLAFADNGKDSLVYPGEFSIVVMRFFHIWAMLGQRKGQYRYMISTDVKDVVFQTNPSTWIEKNIGDKKINVACESIRYEDEEWGRNNLMKSYGPNIYSSLRNNLIYNAGTISGEFDTLIDLFLNVYLLSNAAPGHYIEGGGGPDQAALNVLLSLSPYKDITNFWSSESGYAAQLGTTGPQISKYEKFLVEPRPRILHDNVVCTSTGSVFCMVHQYDRCPEWKKAIEGLYRRSEEYYKYYTNK